MKRLPIAPFLTLLIALSAEARQPQRLPALAPPDLDPTKQDVVLAGEVLLESDGAALYLALDRAGSGSTADGSADHLVYFRSAAPLSPAISFRGEALVDFARRSVRVTPLTGGAGWLFSVDPADESADAATADDAPLLLGDGRALIVRSADFGRSLDQVIADAWKEERTLRRIAGRTPTEEHKGNGDDDEGCATSCQIECAGGGGACSASCPSPSTCAKCSCDVTTNVASCSCRVQ